MAEIEGNAEVGVGKYAFDPVFDWEPEQIEGDTADPSIAFGRFVRLMRRGKGLSLEKLAEDTDVEISELFEIEDDTRHKPELRTVYQLANYFKVPRSNLMQVAGLTLPKDNRLVQEAVRFAARSEPIAELTLEERAALEAFVAVLSEQK